MKLVGRRGCIIFVSLAVLVLIVVVIASQPSDGEPQIRTATSPPVQAQVSQKEDTPTPVLTAKSQSRLGDVVEQYGYSLAAVKVEDPAKPGRLTELESGEKVVAVEIVVGNVSGEPLSVNPLYAELVDEEGFVYEVELAGRDGGQIGVTDLNPGEKARGWVAFIIPEEATPASVKYSLGLFSDDFLQVGVK